MPTRRSGGRLPLLGKEGRRERDSIPSERLRDGRHGEGAKSIGGHDLRDSQRDTRGDRHAIACRSRSAKRLRPNAPVLDELVAFARQLSDDRFKAFPSLIAPADECGSLGRREEGLTRAQEAAGLYRELARARILKIVLAPPPGDVLLADAHHAFP